jgi:hypothetical protein
LRDDVRIAGDRPHLVARRCRRNRHDAVHTKRGGTLKRVEQKRGEEMWVGRDPERSKEPRLSS